MTSAHRVSLAHPSISISIFNQLSPPFRWQPLNLPGPASFRKACFKLFSHRRPAFRHTGGSRSRTPQTAAGSTLHRQDTALLHLPCRGFSRTPTVRRSSTVPKKIPLQTTRPSIDQLGSPSPRSSREGHLNEAPKQMEALTAASFFAPRSFATYRTNALHAPPRNRTENLLIKSQLL